ncbi:transposase [Streptomyces sp. ML-6]|uniref:transposase n=1 Tax=Streptomyces sp. ML-6 TaxID=2982693 RepID=UPI0024BF7C08|nr:transposase [Streptomyces sp. ML-6]MDK0523990.1 transposase [Streptomyces sp. ML-6]
MRIDLSVRHLYCENVMWSKVTFAEQVAGLTLRYQRRTPQLQRLVEDIGVVLAGRGGTRMLRILSIRLSRCTVLSQLMRMPLPPLETPRVLGVDDFALHGDTYGTLLVDATTRLPLTLWEGRDAEQLSRWLREHPGVEFACRDGSLTYRQGIAGGAPDAVQVSDRFHLWQGLSRRVQDIASAHRGCLSAALPPAGESGPAPAEETAGNTAEDSRAARHARRLFEAVQALTSTGQSHSSVARELGPDRRTVSKYARARTWQEVMRRPPRKPSTLDPYLDYLQQRWDEGQHNAKILHEELQTKGYLGHYQRVKMAVAPLRRGLPPDEPRERPPSPHEAARWITTHPHRRNLHINNRLPRLLAPNRRGTHDVHRASGHRELPQAQLPALLPAQPRLPEGSPVLGAPGLGHRSRPIPLAGDPRTEAVRRVRQAPADRGPPHVPSAMFPSLPPGCLPHADERSVPPKIRAKSCQVCEAPSSPAPPTRSTARSAAADGPTSTDASIVAFPPAPASRGHTSGPPTGRLRRLRDATHPGCLRTGPAGLLRRLPFKALLLAQEGKAHGRGSSGGRGLSWVPARPGRI